MQLWSDFVEAYLIKSLFESNDCLTIWNTVIDFKQTFKMLFFPCLSPFCAPLVPLWLADAEL